MKKITLPPQRRPKTESVFPTVMVGKCVFAARRKISLIRASNRPGVNKIIEILVSQSLSAKKATPETLGISVGKQSGRIFLLGGPETETEDIQAQTIGVENSQVEPNEAKIALSHMEPIFPNDVIKFCRHILKSFPKTHTIILSLNINSKKLPLNPEMAASFLSGLQALAFNKKASIILIWDQWSDLNSLTNGPFKGVAEKMFFSIGKLSYTASPDTFLFESIRAPRGHDFWPITYSQDCEGNIYHRGIEKNRVPK